MINHCVSRRLVGRGERIRTSGPCLPKKEARAQKRRKPPLSCCVVAEQTGKNTESRAICTGDAPGHLTTGGARV